MESRQKSKKNRFLVKPEKGGGLTDLAREEAQGNSTSGNAEKHL